MSDPSSTDPLTAAIQQIQRPYALKVLALCSSPHTAPDSTRTAPVGPWRHPSELDYIGPTHPAAHMWNDYAIITFLVRTAITIPPRSDSRSDPWVVITSKDESTTLPRGYRVPILWLMKVQWESLKLLLTVARPLWDRIKYDLLHIARLTSQFLGKARNEERIKRQWRDPMFDRALTRFFNGWMGCRDEFIWDFYREFKDEEYKDDVLARRWAQKVPKGIQGFVITEQELIDGITAEKFMSGLIVDAVNSTFRWTVEPEVQLPPAEPPISPARRKQDEPPTVNSRNSSPLTSEIGSDIEMIAESLNPKASEPSTPASAPTPTPTPTQRPVVPLAIQTGTELQRKKSHKAKPRPKTDRPEKASRPLRTRTSGSISAMSPATPKVAHIASGSVPGSSAASSPNRTPSGFDFTAQVESRGRKRKIESIYSVSPSPLTSDSEDDTSTKSSRGPKNPSRSAPRPVPNATPDGRAFSTNSRIVIPRLTNPEVYSKPTTEAYSAVSVEVHHPTVIKAVRKPSMSESISSPRKAKPSTVPLQLYKLFAISSSPSTNPFDPSNPATSIPPFSTWRHPEELEYIGPNHPTAAAWTDLAIVTYMVDNAFTIPSRNADNKQTWVEVKVSNQDGTVTSTTLPRGYRIPLLWLGRVQWDCLKLLLTKGREHWANLRFDILHIVRLSVQFLAKARREVKIKRQYRDVMFDRALSRFFNGWMGSRDEFVWDFYREFRDEEYEDDMCSRRWLQKAVKGIQGFAITEYELHEGITAEQYMNGLKLDREQGTFEWIDDAPTPTPVASTSALPPPAAALAQPPRVQERSPPPPPPSQQQERDEVVAQSHSPLSLSQVAGVHSRSPSPLTPVGLDNSMDLDPPALSAGQPAVAPASEPHPEQLPTATVTINGAQSALADQVQPPAARDQPDIGKPTPTDIAQDEPLAVHPPPAQELPIEDTIQSGVENAAVPSGRVTPRPATVHATPVAPPVVLPATDVPSVQMEASPPAFRSPLPRWSSPLRLATPPTLGETHGGAGHSAEVPEHRKRPATPSIEHPAPMDTYHQDENNGNEMDADMDADIDADMGDMDAEFLRYPSSPPKSDTAMEMEVPSSALLLFPLPHTNGVLEPHGPTAAQEEDELEFDETDYIRSRLPSPFVMTPTSHSLELELVKSSAKSPSPAPPVQRIVIPAKSPSPAPRVATPARSPSPPPVERIPIPAKSPSPAPAERVPTPVELTPAKSPSPEPPVERIPTPPPVHAPQPIRAQSESSESIRSSSSPEPRIAGPPLPESLARDSAPSEPSAEERLPSPPPDSDEEEAPAPEPATPVGAPEVGVPEVVAPTLAAEVSSRVEVAHILPLSPTDAADEFPPGFHFMGQQGTASNNSITQSLFSGLLSRDSTPAGLPQMQPLSQDIRSDSLPSEGVQIRSTADPARPSASPSINGHAPLVADDEIVARAGPTPITAETLVSSLPSSDSKRVKLEIMTVSLGSGNNDAIGIEEETDMDIETPIDVDMDDRTPSPSTPAAPASPQLPSPPLSASQSLFTPDATPRSVPAPAAVSGHASQPIGLAGPPHPPSQSPAPAVPSSFSSQNNEYMVAPGLSTITNRGSSNTPNDDYNIFGRPSPASSRPSPLSRYSPPSRYPPSSHSPLRRSPPHGHGAPSTQRAVGRNSSFPPQNGSNMNGVKDFSGGFSGGTFTRPPLAGTLFLRDKPPAAPAPRRMDIPMDDTSHNFRPPIRIPDERNPMEYDPRRQDPIVLGPSSSYSIPSIPPVQQAPVYPRWMGYSTPNGGVTMPGGSHRPYSPVVPVPYSPLVPLNMNRAPPNHNQALPTHVQALPTPPPYFPPPVVEPVVAHRPSSRVSRTPDVIMAEAENTRVPARSPSLFSASNVAVHSSPKPSSPGVLPPVNGSLFEPDVTPEAPPRVDTPQAASEPPEDMDTEEVPSPRRSPSPHSLINGAPPEIIPDPPSSVNPSTESPTTPSTVPAAPQVYPPPEIDMRSLENSLVVRLREELKSQLKNELKDELKGELRGELKGELKGELRGELKGELKGELQNELQGELKGQLQSELQGELKSELEGELKDQLMLQLREELPGQMKQELLGQLSEELVVQMKEDLLVQLKDELVSQLKTELLTQLKVELLAQLKDDLLLRLKDELLVQLQKELLALLKDDLKAQLADDLTVTLKNSLREQLRADLKDDMLLELKDHFNAQLKERLRVLLIQLKDAVNSQLRDDLIIQLKYFIAKLKEELITQLKDTLTVHLKDGLITQVKAALTAQLRDGLGAQREQLNLDFERRRLYLEQQPRVKAPKPASPAASTPSRPTPTTPRPLPSLLFQARHPLHHLVLSTTPDVMDVDAPIPPPTPPVSVSPSKPKGSETPLPVKSQRKQSWFATGYQAS